MNIFEELKKANIEIVNKNLAFNTFGNVSARYKKDFFIIKPSGINLNKTNSKKYPIINIKSEKKTGSFLNPSSDTLTHLEIYKAFPEVNAISHFHSEYACAWAQANKSIPILGTTHADYWKEAIPITDLIQKKYLDNNYEDALCFCAARTPDEVNVNKIFYNIHVYKSSTLITPGGYKLNDSKLRKLYDSGLYFIRGWVLSHESIWNEALHKYQVLNALATNEISNHQWAGVGIYPFAELK